MYYSKYSYISVDIDITGQFLRIAAWKPRPDWDSQETKFRLDTCGWWDMQLFGLDIPDIDIPSWASVPGRLYATQSTGLKLYGTVYEWDGRYWGEIENAYSKDIKEETPHISVTIGNETTPIDPDYEALFLAMFSAFDQGAKGKGKERHGNDLTYLEQPICTLPKQGHGLGALTYQISKKAGEANTLLDIKGVDAAIREIKGCVNYGAAALIYLESLKENK
jgi:hypothetical protein